MLDINKIDNIYTLTERLIAQNDDNLLKIKNLESRCKELELKIQEKDNLIRDIKDKNKDLKLQGIQSNLNAEDKKILKSRLNELIKDVDRCIVTLSN
ncbi:MAG: hypothetical protein MRY83_06250 [Flavobacteriales bacterium]|nr:hypothetical protein [Flavobacteriales bacterium]